jgi:CHRD domain
MRAVLACVAVLFAGCGRATVGSGGAGEQCYANGSCNVSLTCASNLCVSLAGTDGGAGRAGTGGGAGTGDAFGSAGTTGSGANGGAAGSASGGPGGTPGAAGAGGTAAGGAGGLALKTYNVTLNGAMEGLTGVTGTGTATVTLDPNTGAVTVNGTFTGLTGLATMAHIHGLATPPAAAGVILGLTATTATSGTLTGSGTLSANNTAGMIAGMTYLNIHTPAKPGGEIRGNIGP